MVFRFEHARQPLAKRNKFLLRLAANLGVALALIAVSLLIGMLGYHGFERMNWVDAFANAAMILSGMGPFGELHTDDGKLFAGFYAIYSGIVLIAATGLLLVPLLHRVMHRLHAVEDSESGKEAGRGIFARFRRRKAKNR